LENNFGQYGEFGSQKGSTAEVVGQEIGAFVYQMHPATILPELILGNEGPAMQTAAGIGVSYAMMFVTPGGAAKGGANLAKAGVNAAEGLAVHGNSLKSLRPTWGYKLYSQDGTFLKNGITSAKKAESRYSKTFMSTKYMDAIKFPNRRAAYNWEFQQNQILKGPLNLNNH
jgi:hypothetical protein